MMVGFELLGKKMSAERPAPPAELPAYVTDPIERQDPDALEAVRDYVDDLLAYHRTVEAQDLEGDDLADEGEELVDVEENEGGTIVVKKVPCGKECDGCPHGPYAYRVQRQGDKVEWEYLGKRDS
jgi:hypothetical protein